MLSLLVVMLFIAVMIALGLAFGGAFLAVGLVIAAIVVLAWAIKVFSGRSDAATTSQNDVPERVETPELLGPGGPDDPRPKSSA
jgi:hypothetical protein